MKKIMFFAAALLAAQTAAFAQGRGGRGGAAAAPQTPKASAPIDVTGYWVSIVTEDWRYRMVAPTKGEVLCPIPTHFSTAWSGSPPPSQAVTASVTFSIT